MNTFHIKPCVLPHDGIIPGARGHKKIVVPKGTIAYVICYERKMFGVAYLNKQSALTVARSLEDIVEGRTRARRTRYLVAWSFKSTIPVCIHREK